MAFLTFDLFSALIDSRSGGTRALARIGDGRGWPVSAEAVYDEWDARNKASQEEEATWISFAEHSRRALTGTYQALALHGDPDADIATVLASVSHWPLWPDVMRSWTRLGAQHRLGVLSNVDDAVFARTRVAALVHPADVLTSQRPHAYKPGSQIYRAAVAAGVDVHVPASARDTRGALEAGLAVVRVRRPGHHVDPRVRSPPGRSRT